MKSYLKKTIIVFTIIILFLQLLQARNEQTKEKDSQNSLPTKKSELIRKEFDTKASSINKLKSVYIDSVLKSFKSLNSLHLKLLKNYADSLVITNKDTLDSKKVDSISILRKALDSKLLRFADDFKILLNSENEYFRNNINKIRDSLLSGVNTNDVTALRNNFIQIANGIADENTDRITNISDSISDAEQETYENARDSITDFAEMLKENAVEEKEMIDERNQEIQDSTNKALQRESKLELGLGFNSHSSYRGRDNGIYDQYYFSPSVSYIHKSGFSLSLSTFILHRSPNFFDETSLGVAYDAEISDYFSFSLSYSRFWFSINSFLSNSDLNNSVEASFSFNSFGFTLNPVISVDFSTYTESNLFLYFSWYYGVEDAFGIMDLSVEPSILFVLGEQNKNLVISRKKKGHSNPIDINILTNNFSVMDYEFTLPLSLDFRQFIVKPYMSLIIPVNVLDNSTKDPFAAIGIDFTYIIR